MKSKDFEQMVVNSINKLGRSTKGEYVKDVIRTAVREGKDDEGFMIRLANIGWVCQNFKKKKMVSISKSNKCDCGRCEAGTISGLHDGEYMWSLI